MTHNANLQRRVCFAVFVYVRPECQLTFLGSVERFSGLSISAFARWNFIGMIDEVINLIPYVVWLLAFELTKMPRL